MSREDAKAAGLKSYFDGQPCPRGHSSARIVKDNACRECGRARMNNWRRNNRERANANELRRNKRWRAEHPEKWKQRSREYARRKHAAHPEIHRRAQAKWDAKNADAIKRISAEKYQRNKAKCDERSRLWYLNHRDVRNAKCSRRRASLLNATPSWLTGDHWKQIRQFYSEAQRKSRQTGIEHHVDHVVPLKSPIVCGLHVPWNLQVITESENSRKRNKFIAV